MSDELPAIARAGEAGARPGGTWGSALTTQKVAVIRSVGFEPVGQVFGAAGDARGYDCPGAWGSSGATTPAQPATQLSGRGDLGSFGPLVETMYQARHTVIDRTTAECGGLGGNGVAEVRLSRRASPLGGLEFTAIATAVRAGRRARAAGVINLRHVRSGFRGMMTGRLPARRAGGRATSRWPAGPSWRIAEHYAGVSSSWISMT